MGLETDRKVEQKRTEPTDEEAAHARAHEILVVALGASSPIDFLLLKNGIVGQEML